MKLAAAFLLICSILLALAPPAAAQPRGSYLRSCRDVAMRGDSLLAVCRRINGRWQPTRLDRVRGCIGDIGNDDGNLVCNRR